MREASARLDPSTIASQNALGFARRLMIYQSERFPLHKNGLLITVFTFASIAYSRAARGVGDFVEWHVFLLGAATAILLFALLRIADEFKDHEEDVRFRPYRAVPRGLVSLRELSRVGIGIVTLVVALNAIVMPRMLPALIAVLVFTGLMFREFFVRDWLKRHPMTYMVSHMIFMPLVDLYTTGLDWLHAGVSPSATLAFFLVVSFLNGIVIEVGRKLRAPEEEEHGVETCSAMYGYKKASIGLGVVYLLSALCAVLASSGFASRTWVMIGIGVLLTIGSIALARFTFAPTPSRSKLVEDLSGVWVLAIYLLLGLIPLLTG
jgi:hypothetical protein